DPLLKNPRTPKVQWGTGGLSLLGNEFSDMKHERGVVSTVSIPGKANSEGAQFFVCVSPQPALDGKFSTFGRMWRTCRRAPAAAKRTRRIARPRYWLCRGC